MSQSSKLLAKDTKKQEEKFSMNVDDLMNEDDDDNDDSDDDELSPDEDLESFYIKNGIQKKQTLTSNNPMSSSNLRSVVEDPKTNSFKSATAQLISVQELNIQKNTTKTALSHISSAIETPQDHKALTFLDNLSDSSDEDDKLILQSLLIKRNKQNYSSQKSPSKKDEQMNSSMSDSTDDRSFKGIAGRASTQIQKQGSVVKENAKQTDIIDIIEKNEKMNEACPDKLIEQPSQLLSFDNKFYNVQKKLMVYSDFPQISKKLHFQKDHQYSGVASSIAMYQNYLFVGNSSGIIRVFDLKSQKEMKPLMDQNQLGGNKVSSIEISKDGGFLISGYKKGQIVLWDLVKYKLLKIAGDFHTSEVINARIYYISEEEVIHTVSAEDSGVVSLTEFKKSNFLGGYSYVSQYLFKTRLKGTASMVFQKKNDQYPSKFADNNQLIAFGALNEVVICTMRPVKEVFQVFKPNFCKEKSLPYLDWGYGLTPSQREKTVPILAFAWDRLIQLVYINESNGETTFEMDGFYYSDQEINSISFIGDSILFALVNGKEVKVLYTTKFYPGHFKYLENARKDDLLNNQFEKVITVTAHSEIEKGYEVQDIRSTILQCQSVMNFNQCVKRYKANVFFMGNKNVLQGHLFSWKEYLDHIKFKENYDWLTVLKVGLEIYTGDSKGFAKVPDEKEKREKLLKPHMKEIIKDSIQSVIFKYNQSSQRTNDTQQEEEKKNSNSSKQPRQVTKQSEQQQLQQESYQADSIAIKVAIEFCLNINATQYLFTEIYQIFVENRLELKFLQNLEPFILSGQFRKEVIPEAIIKKIIQHYEDKGKLRVLEKIIMNLDFKEYSRKEELILICQAHCMVSAFLYLMTSHSDDDLGCMQILNTMAKLMRNAKNQDYQREDIYSLSVVDSTKKYDIEKSKSYIGYKLLWIIKMFLEGKMFPYGSLSPEKWRMHVYDIANFVTTDEFLKELINFDAEQFFRITAKLFYGVPYKYLITMEEHNQQRQRQKLKGGLAILCMKPQEMMKEFEKKCSNNQEKMENFYKFILYIQSQHVEDSVDNPPIELDYAQVFNAILSTLNKKPITMDEDVLINTIKGKKIKKEDLDTIINQLDLQTQSLSRLRIYIVEKKKDFVQSFRLNLSNLILKKSIFTWIDNTLESLQANGESIQPFEQLKKAMKVSMQELISINVSEAIKVIEKWYDESYIELLIRDELAQHQDIQFDFLKKFLIVNEEKIKATIQKAQISNEKKAEAAQYIQYLVLHTQLLCIFSKNEVEEYVKKDYYPITECLEICKSNEIYRGVAVLQKRGGNYLGAITTYLNIIRNMDIPMIISELNKIVAATANSKNAGGHNSHKWDFLECQKYKSLNEFDILLQKSMKIANKRSNEQGEEGWFVIIEFLNEYAHQLNEKFEKIVQGGTMSLKQIQNEKANLEKLKDFVVRRKNIILKTVPTSISLKTLTERLNLTFSQIKKLYDFKIRAIKNDEKYLKLAKTIQIHEVLKLSSEVVRERNVGMSMNEQDKCLQCADLINLNTQKQPFNVYQCKHYFHINCLKDKRCNICNKLNIGKDIHSIIITILDLGLKEQSKKGKSGPKEKDLEDEEQKAQRLQMAASQIGSTQSGNDDSGSSQPATKSQSILLKQLEYFDMNMQQSGLKKASFY